MKRSNSYFIKGPFKGPFKPRTLLLCIAAVLSYCFVITVLLFHYYLYSDRPCGQIEKLCNRSVFSWIGSDVGQVINDTGLYNMSINWTTTIYLENITTTLHPVEVVLMEYQKSAFIYENPLNLCPSLTVDNITRPGINVLNNNAHENEIIQSHPELSLGGHWKPRNCTSRHKVALIIPYRDRKSHLLSLINYLIPMLQKQQLDFRFIVTEQLGDGLFNKGRIMNAAFQIAERMRVHCVIFHDVDMFPENEWTPYTCPDQPRHLGAYVNVLGYSLWYHYLLGGVVSIRMEHYRQVNGHSNEYWGWGGEDDDFGKRVLANNLTIERMPVPFSKYSMLRHNKRKYAVRDNVRKLLNDTETRWPYDGLNDTRWTIASLIPKPLYYHLFVDVGEPTKDWRPAPRKSSR